MKPNSKRRTNAMYVFYLLYTLLVDPVAAQATSPIAEVSQIASVQAYLFNSKTGALSEDILASGAPKLVDIPFGAYASVSTLVVVKVIPGHDRPRSGDLKLQVRAVEQLVGRSQQKAPGHNTRTLLATTSRVGTVTSESEYFGFWLSETGCNPVSLSLSFPNAKGKPGRSVDLPFSCTQTTSSASKQTSTTTATIAGFEARPFIYQTGSFGKDLLQTNEWVNRMDTTATLVVVKVDLRIKGTPPSAARLRLTAIEDGNLPHWKIKGPRRRVLASSSRLGPVESKDDMSTTYVGYWLPNTGCNTIQLTAKLSDKGRSSKVREQNLDFYCAYD